MAGLDQCHGSSAVLGRAALPTSASVIAQPEGECHRFVVFVSPCARTVGVQVSRRARRAGVIERESHPINGVLNHAL